MSIRMFMREWNGKLHLSSNESIFKKITHVYFLLLDSSFGLVQFCKTRLLKNSLVHVFSTLHSKPSHLPIPIRQQYYNMELKRAVKLRRRRDKSLKEKHLKEMLMEQKRSFD